MRKQQSAARWGGAAVGVALVVGGGLAQPMAAAAGPDQLMALTQYVDPLIGTSVPTSSGYQGNVAPGAQVPFGMVNFGPDMPRSDYNGSGGYKLALNATSGSINFFSLTHLNGPGCPGGGVVGMMPATTARSVANASGVPQAVTFQTADESVSPGYYSVKVSTGVTAELSATTRTGIARFTYPDKDSGYYALDTRLNANSNLSSTRGKVAASNVALNIEDDGRVLTGKTVAPAFCTPWGTNFNSNVYFYAQLDKPLRAQADGSTVNTVVNGASVLQYDLTDDDPTLTMRVGISSVSIANAQLNLTTEDASSTFDQVRAAADADWNARLNTVQIDQAADPSALTGEQRDRLTKFYTALYRVFVSPTTYSDVNGDYRSMEATPPLDAALDLTGGVQERPTQNVADDAFTRLDGTTRTPAAHYSGLSMWDTYRSAAQALSLFAPEVSNDVMQSLVADAEQCGAFPHWVDNSDDSVPMAGDNALPVIAASYAFGARDFDLTTAARLVKQSVSDPTSSCNGHSSSSNLAQYLDYGYRAVGVDGQTSSSNIEQNASDHAAGMFLSALPTSVLWDPSVDVTDADIAQLDDRASWWKNIFDYAGGKIAQRAAPTTPGTLGALSTGVFHESTEPNYFWSFGYAWPDLIDAIGGKANAVTRLNTLFSLDDALTATPTRKQLNGGQDATTYYMGNEMSFPAPWAYNWAGRPQATQYIVQQLMSTAFTTGRDGLPGNDDFGALSSWYVFAGLGMYPASQADGGMALSTPQFPAMTVHLGDRTLRIVTDQDPATAPFIQSMSINGTAQDRSWASLDALTGAKTTELSYQLSATPSTWATTTSPVDPAASQTWLSVSAEGQTYGTSSPATATASVTFSDGVAQPGTVQLRTGSKLIESVALGKGGSVTLTLPPGTPVGTHALTAVFVPSDSSRVDGSTSDPATFVVSAEVVADTSVLQAVYDAAAALSNDDGTYTPASWSAFTARRTAAATVLGDPSATQDAVDAAVVQLNQAMAGLVVAPAAPDSSVLQSTYDAARALSNADGTYTASSWQALQVAVGVAQTVLADSSATQTQLDAATTGLTTALAGLEVSTPAPDASVLQAVYDHAAAVSNGDGTYTEESWAALQTALSAAEAVLTGGSATQAQIDAAVDQLSGAVAGLAVAPVEPPAPSKAVLESVHGSAAALSNANGIYTAESWSALQASLSAAKAVLDDDGATQAQIDSAATALSAALAGLVPTEPTTPVPPRAVVAKVKLGQKQLRLVKGRSLTVPGAVYYTDSRLQPSYGGKVTWKSSSKKVAKVSKNGRITAKKAGKAVITVTSTETSAAGKKLSASIKIKVVKAKHKAKAKKVTTSVPSSLTVGQTAYVTGRYKPKKATGVKVRYSSTKASVVAVDKVGRVVAVSPGTAKVKVKAGGKTKAYKVRVQ